MRVRRRAASRLGGRSSPGRAAKPVERRSASAGLSGSSSRRQKARKVAPSRKAKSPRSLVSRHGAGRLRQPREAEGQQPVGGGRGSEGRAPAEGRAQGGVPRDHAPAPASARRSSDCRSSPVSAAISLRRAKSTSRLPSSRASVRLGAGLFRGQPHGDAPLGGLEPDPGAVGKGVAGAVDDVAVEAARVHGQLAAGRRLALRHPASLTLSVLRPPPACRGRRRGVQSPARRRRRSGWIVLVGDAGHLRPQAGAPADLGDVPVPLRSRDPLAAEPVDRAAGVRDARIAARERRRGARAARERLNEG